MDRPHFTALDTPRLKVRRFTDADCTAFRAYRNDPEVARYQSWEGCSEDEAARFIDAMKTAPCGLPGVGFQFAVELKATGALIGDCYLLLDAQEPRLAEIGFTLARAHQSQGLATEAVACVLNYAFVTFDLHRVIAITDCENAASVALLERLGFRREGHFLQNVWFKGRWGDEYLYALLKEEWSVLPQLRERQAL